jgi:hypothetical protein
VMRAHDLRTRAAADGADVHVPARCRRQPREVDAQRGVACLGGASHPRHIDEGHRATHCASPCLRARGQVMSRCACNFLGTATQ